MRLTTLFGLLFIALNTYASPLQSQRQFENSGGLIDHISPLLIPDKNASVIENITLDDRGQITKRNGYTIINTTGAIGTSSIKGGGYHSAATGNSFFAVVSGTNVYKTGTTFSAYTDVSSNTITITNTASNLFQTTGLNDKLIFCSDLDRPFYLGSTGNAVPISSSTISGAKTCATYGFYLIIGNTTESSVAYPSRIRWSDVNNQDSFPNLNYIDVESNDGDVIVSIISFDDSVYVFKRHSIYRMVITGAPGADAFIIRPVVRNIGAWAKNSVKVIPNVGIAFLAQNTMYVLNDRGLEPIGDPIQRTFDGLTRTMWANAVAEVYPKRYQYWLAVSTTTDSQNHKVLVYDYVQKAWTVYTGMNINMLSQAEDSTGNNILVSGDYSGNTYKQDIGTSDTSLNVSTSIPASYTTADQTFGSPEVTKNFKYLYVFSQVDVNTTVTIETAYEYQATFDTPMSLNLGQVGALYDIAIYDTDIYPNLQYKVSRIELNRSARALKLRFSNSSSASLVGIIGWVVVYSMEDYRQ